MFNKIALTSLTVAGVATTAVLGSANMASAAIFNFSFSNVTGAIGGTVSGTIELPDGDGTFAATSVIVTSAPAGLGYDPTTTNFIGTPENVFSVVGGNIVVANTSFLGLFDGRTALALSATSFADQTFLDAFSAADFGVSGVLDTTSSTLSFSPAATTPEPGTLLGLLAVGSIGALTRKRKG